MAVLFVVGLGAITLTGCASIINGSQQVVRIETPHTTNATCILSNSKGEWTLQSTPGSIKVRRDSEKLSILCHKKDYADGALQVTPLYNMGNIGNLLVFGGVAGMLVDDETKATFSYPEKIRIPMRSLVYPYY